MTERVPREESATFLFAMENIVEDMHRVFEFAYIRIPKFWIDVSTYIKHNKISISPCYIECLNMTSIVKLISSSIR